MLDVLMSLIAPVVATAFNAYLITRSPNRWDLEDEFLDNFREKYLTGHPEPGDPDFVPGPSGPPGVDGPPGLNLPDESLAEMYESIDKVFAKLRERKKRRWWQGWF